MDKFLRYSWLNQTVCFSNLSNRFYVFALLIFFAGISIVYYSYFGLRFDAGTLNYYWQLVDPYLLKNKLLESIYYLHQQPPLFNLFLGIILQLFPDHYVNVFYGFYLTLGLIFTITLFFNMYYLGANRNLSFVLTVLLIASPRIAFYEHQLFFEFPMVVMFSVSLFFFLRFIKHEDFWDAFSFFSSALCLAFLRPGPQFLIFLFSFILLLIVKSKLKKRIMLSFCVPFIIFFSIHTKHFLLFHELMFGTHYQANNLSIMAVTTLPKTLRDRLVAQGKISSISLEGFKTKPKIEKLYGVAVLDEKNKSTHRKNYNQSGYLEAARIKMKDALYVLKNYPSGYLKYIHKTFNNYFFAQDLDVRRNFQISPHFVELKRFYCYLSGVDSPNKVSWVLLFLYPFLIVYAVYKLINYLLLKQSGSILFLGLLFTVGSILLMSLTFCLGSIADQCRYRLEIESFYWIIGSVLLMDIYLGIKQILVRT